MTTLDRNKAKLASISLSQCTFQFNRLTQGLVDTSNKFAYLRDRTIVCIPLPRLKEDKLREPDFLPLVRTESIIIWIIIERQSATLAFGAQDKAGLYPFTSITVTEAPFSSNVWVTATSPFLAAICKGLTNYTNFHVSHAFPIKYFNFIYVLRSEFAASINSDSVILSRSIRAADSAEARQAWCKAVFPFRSRLERSTHWVSNNSKTSETNTN